MADIATIWSPGTGEGGWAVAGAALEEGDDLATATLISLFTDRQANTDDEVPDGDRRGWWGDPTMGSRLWLLERAKATEETRSRAEEYAKEALAWMVDDEVAASVTATATWLSKGLLALVVRILRTDGTRRVIGYAFAWDGSVAAAAGAVPAVLAHGELDFSDPANSALLPVI